MTGEAHVLVDESLLQKVRHDSGVRDVVVIKKETVWGDGLWMLLVRSPLLKKGYHGMQVMVLVNGRLDRFAPDVDV